MHCWPFQRCCRLHLYLAPFSCLVSTRWNEGSCSCCIIPVWLTTAARIGPRASFWKRKPANPVTTLTVHFLNTIHNQTNSLVRDSITYGFSTKGVCFSDKTVGISEPASLGSDVAVMCREAKRKREARSINLQLYFWDWLKATKNLGNHWVLCGIHLHIVHFCLMCLKVWDCEWRDPTAQSKAKLNWCECHMWRETPFALFSLPSSSALFMILYHVNVKICLWYPQICPRAFPKLHTCKKPIFHLFLPASPPILFLRWQSIKLI